MADGRILAFLSGAGRDGRGRRLDEVLAFDDRRLEAVHDYIQWLFPLPDASRAVPDSPVLDDAEAAAIRTDATARAGLRAALARMSAFYRDTGGWLVPADHNHLRITRIIAATRDLLGAAEADAFHDLVIRRNAEAGSPVSKTSLLYWSRALGR